MQTQLLNNDEALRLFFTEDIYLLKENSEKVESMEEVAEIISNLNVAEKIKIPAIKPKVEFNFLGKNQRHVLILVNDSENEVSTLQGRELLRKLVKAIGLTANDFALVNYANYPSEMYEELNAFFSCKLMLAFGVASTDLGLPTAPLHQLVQDAGVTHIFAKNLNDLDSDMLSKKQLWANLQQLKV